MKIKLDENGKNNMATALGRGLGGLSLEGDDAR